MTSSIEILQFRISGSIKFIISRSTVLPTTVKTPTSTDISNAQTTIDIFAPTASASIFGDITSLFPSSASTKVVTGDRSKTLASVTATSVVDIFEPTAQNAFQSSLNTGPSSAVSQSQIVTQLDTSNVPTTVDIFAPTTPGSLIPTVPPEIISQATDLPISVPSTDLPISAQSTDLPTSAQSTDLPTSAQSRVNVSSLTGNDTVSLITDPQLQLTADILNQHTAKNEKCPKFPARYVEDALVLDLYTPGGCQIYGYFHFSVDEQFYSKSADLIFPQKENSIFFTTCVAIDNRLFNKCIVPSVRLKYFRKLYNKSAEQTQLTDKTEIYEADYSVTIASTSVPIALTTPTRASLAPTTVTLASTSVTIAPTGVTIAPTTPASTIVTLAPTSVYIAPTYVTKATLSVTIVPTSVTIVRTSVAIVPISVTLAPIVVTIAPLKLRVRIPSVAFRQVSKGNINTDIICPKFPVEVTGSTVKVDTLPGVCKMVFTTRTFPVGATSPNEGFSGSYTSMIVTRPVFESEYRGTNKMSFLKPSGGGYSENSSNNDLTERRDSFITAAPGTPSASAPRGRRRSTVGNIMMTTESIKERQNHLGKRGNICDIQKAKDQREQRKHLITGAHKYIMQLVANHIGLEYSNVEDFILDSDRNMQLFSQFMEKEGTNKTLMFYYQDSIMPGVEGSHNTFYILSLVKKIVNNSGYPKGTVTPRVFITSGTGEKLRGICVYFIRVKMDIALSIKNIHEYH
ncbi:LOW QUALITY PROTEIN: hypothetical protein KUTeg_006159 [Tegillarca granosa]|uniref:Uncharacterized protein n=1 Tax=Tegillarca granosa TaxID=220873 RepID=A0ABQ9FFS4_TEGGR|nr:LOW QUALITY PROTEIN: hypothetical protein KUTeg_006159 [Tegillarca granosa]